MKYVTLSAVLASILQIFPKYVRLTRKSKELPACKGMGLLILWLIKFLGDSTEAEHGKVLWLL